MLPFILAMLHTGEPFYPSDLQNDDMPEELQKKRTIAAAKDAVKLQVSPGLVADGSISYLSGDSHALCLSWQLYRFLN